jgi:hypothetical protein
MMFFYVKLRQIKNNQYCHYFTYIFLSHILSNKLTTSFFNKVYHWFIIISYKSHPKAFALIYKLMPHHCN